MISTGRRIFHTKSYSSPVTMFLYDFCYLYDAGQVSFVSNCVSTEIRRFCSSDFFQIYRSEKVILTQAPQYIDNYHVC